MSTSVISSASKLVRRAEKAAKKAHKVKQAAKAALGKLSPRKTADPYRILPQHSEAERAAIFESIKAHGLESPIIMDEEGHIIDGHLRREICEKLEIDWHVGAIVRVGMTDDQKKAMAITLNLARRSTPPTNKQRQEYAKSLLMANPEQSDGCIAAVVGLNGTTVFKYRRELLNNRKLKPVTHTVGKDGRRRKVSSDKRKSSFQVRSRNEYEKYAPAARELIGTPKLPKGIIRRPNRLPAWVKRKKTLESVAHAKTFSLPNNIDIQHSDYRRLKVQPGSVDLICTDVVWSNDSQKDWTDLAKLSLDWLKPDGLFVTIIGSFHLDLLIKAFTPHLFWRRLFFFTFNNTCRCPLDNCVERVRPIAIFSKSKKHDFCHVLDTVTSNGAEKDYDDWQQPLPVVKELIRRLSPREGLPALVVDPQLGTGTTAVACCQLPGKSFLGCDIDAKKIKIARHRVATEGVEKSA